MARHPDFPTIQQRLKALGKYDAAIDDEWGPSMSAGISSILGDAEKAAGIEPAPRPPAAVAVTGAQFTGRNLPNAYGGWLRKVGVVPRHLAIAIDLMGTVEVPGEANSPIIMGWRDECRAAGIGIDGYLADSVPWCGLFMAYVMLKADRVVVDKPLWALNWSHFGEPGGQPELGDVLTFKRKGGGHVAIYIAEDREHYHILGGNQADQVNIMRIEKARMHSCRQPPYKVKPASVQPYVVASGGAISHNEA